MERPAALVSAPRWRGQALFLSCAAQRRLRGLTAPRSAADCLPFLLGGEKGPQQEGRTAHINPDGGGPGGGAGVGSAPEASVTRPRCEVLVEEGQDACKGGG